MKIFSIELAKENIWLFFSEPGKQPEIWMTQLFAIVLCVLTLNFLLKLFLNYYIGRYAALTKSPWDDALFHSAYKPLSWFSWIYGLCFAGDLLYAVSKSPLFEVIHQIRSLAIIVLIAWFLVRFIRAAELNLSDEEFCIEPMDPTTLAAVSKLLRMSVIITAVLIVMQALGYSVSGVLAFGGIGGIAVGFAAKDLLANFFGGMMIYLDRPFTAGDWVRSPDREIEGTVEAIGWRLTRIRTFDQRPLYVPNAVFTQIAVENPSRMNNRRINECIGVRYCDIHKIEGIVSEIKSYLRQNAEIDQHRTLIVNFNQFSPSSLDILVYTFTKTTVWIEFHEVKHRVLLDIAAIIEKHGAQIAYPTSTVHLEKTELSEKN